MERQFIVSVGSYFSKAFLLMHIRYKIYYIIAERITKEKRRLVETQVGESDVKSKMSQRC
jgi:hypothetical protein